MFLLYLEYSAVLAAAETTARLCSNSHRSPSNSLSNSFNCSNVKFVRDRLCLLLFILLLLLLLWVPAVLVPLQLIECDITEMLDDCVVGEQIDVFDVEPVPRPAFVALDLLSFRGGSMEPPVFRTFSDDFNSNLSEMENY